MTSNQLTITLEKLELNKNICLSGTGLCRWKNVRVFKRPGPRAVAECAHKDTRSSKIAPALGDAEARKGVPGNRHDCRIPQPRKTVPALRRCVRFGDISGGQCLQRYLRFVVTNFGRASVHLLRFPELLFQIFAQLQETLRRDGVIEQGNSPLGLFQAPL